MIKRLDVARMHPSVVRAVGKRQNVCCKAVPAHMGRLPNRISRDRLQVIVNLEPEQRAATVAPAICADQV